MRVVFKTGFTVLLIMTNAHINRTVHIQLYFYKCGNPNNFITRTMHVHKHYEQLHYNIICMHNVMYIHMQSCSESAVVCVRTVVMPCLDLVQPPVYMQPCALVCWPCMGEESTGLLHNTHTQCIVHVKMPRTQTMNIRSTRICPGYTTYKTMQVYTQIAD